MKRYKIIEDGIEYEVRESSNGNKFWYLNDLYHRENGPAIELVDGTQYWCKYGSSHRTDGAAAIYPSGLKEYQLNGFIYPNITSDEEWLLFQIIT
jgi:hypothetical protein